MSRKYRFGRTPLRGGPGSVESRNVVSATKRFATPVDVVVEEVLFLVIDMRYIPTIWSDEPYSKKLTEVILFLVPDPV